MRRLSTPTQSLTPLRNTLSSQMFSRALSSSNSKTGVDGVILTKFDTVSDKVGSAVTLSHVTGGPVIFVGVGQKYNHLKKLSVRAVVKSLFKD